MNLKKAHSVCAADRADPSQNNKKHKNNNNSALITAIGGVVCTLCAMRPVVITNINQCIFLVMLADD
jgi:hypothetical protein